MVCLSGQLKIVCRGGDAVKKIAKVFNWIKKLLKKEKLPESIKIQAENSFIILFIHKD